MKKTTIYSFYLLLILAFLNSCQEEERQNPIGIWSEISNPENKMIVHTMGLEKVVTRTKDDYYWYSYLHTSDNVYLGEGEQENNLEILDNGNLEVFNKEMRVFKKVYKKIPASTEPFWFLYEDMPKELVIEFLGNPDSISNENSLEEWFYDKSKVIRFNEKEEIASYSENHVRQPDFSKINVGDFYTQVEEILGDPYQTKAEYDLMGIPNHDMFYGNNKKIVARDSIVTQIIPDIERYNQEQMALIDAEAIPFDFAALSEKELKITVEEKGKITEVLKPSISRYNHMAYLRLSGKKYNVVFLLMGSNEFKAILSRKIKRRRHKEDNLEIKLIENMIFYVDPNLLSSNKIASTINIIIKERNAKNTIITGSFILDMPE